MISKISLKNFRCFNDITLDISNSLVILSGKNATGKTSILEAIYLCSTSKSHRTNDLDTIIKNDKEFFIIEIEDFKKYKYVYSKVGKSLFINKCEINKVSEFIGNLFVVMYSPLDIELIHGTKSSKRKFLDMEISLLDKKYLNDLNIYKKILSERNNLLKQNDIDLKLLDVIDKNMATYNNLIYQKRIEFINDLNKYLKIITKDLEMEDINLVYKNTYDASSMYEYIKKHEKTDILTKVTNIGIQRDDFLILIDSKDSKEYASEGQARLICIIIKLALKLYIENKYNIEPILLLDDVFAALDKDRISRLIKYILNTKQAFISTTSVIEIPDELLKKAFVIRMEKER